MYSTMPYQQSGGLGFSLKPPAWLRNAVSEAWQKTTVPSTTIPLPGGGKVQLPGKGQTFTEQVSDRVESVPGGWYTVAGVTLLAVLVLPRILRGR